MRVLEILDNWVTVFYFMQSFRDLHAWQAGMKLVDEIYTITSTFPHTETFGLTSQLRRAVTSIVANIAEGFGRYSYPDKAHKFTIARGECAEVEAHLLVAIQQKFTNEENTKQAFALIGDTGKLLSGLIKSCNTHKANQN